MLALSVGVSTSSEEHKYHAPDNKLTQLRGKVEFDRTFHGFLSGRGEQ